MIIEITQKDELSNKIKESIESLSTEQLILLVLKLVKENYDLKLKLKEYQNILDDGDLK